MAIKPGYIVVDEGGVRLGSAEDGPLPMAGDILIMRHPDDTSPPAWEVLRREFVNGQDIVVVVRDAARSATDGKTDWADST